MSAQPTTRIVTFRLPVELVARLDARAKALGWTRTRLVRAMMELNDRRARGPKAA